MPIKESEVTSVISTLPEHSFVRRYVEYAANLTDANIAFHIAGAFAVLSTTIPHGERGLTADFGGRVVPNLCMLLYGDSTDSRKTTAIKIAIRLTGLAQKSAVGSEPGSAEGLIEAIRDNRRQTIFSPEWGDFLKKTQGNSYMASLKMVVNNLADSMPLGRALGGVNTKAKTKDAVDNYMVSLLGGVAPVLLERYADYEDWTGGFFGRFLLLDAPRQRYTPVPHGAPDIEAQLCDWLKTRLKNQAVGRFIGFDASAFKMWTEFSEDVEWMRRRVSKNTVTSVSRAQQIAFKMAMQFAWDFGEAGSGKDWQITAMELGPALAIARMHIRSAVSIIATIAPNQDMRDRRTILAKIDRHIPSTFGEVIRDSMMLKPRVKAILESCYEEGSVAHSPIADGSGKQGWIRVALLPHEEAEEVSPIDLIGTGKLKQHYEELERKRAADRAAAITAATNIVQMRPTATKGHYAAAGSRINGNSVVESISDGIFGPEGTDVLPTANPSLPTV